MPLASISQATTTSLASNNTGKTWAVRAGALLCTEMQIRQELLEPLEASLLGWLWTASRDAITSTSERQHTLIQRWGTAPIWPD